MRRVENYRKQREAELREKLVRSDVDDVDGFVQEMKETPDRSDLKFIHFYDQVLRVRIDDEKYVRVYMIPLADPMYVTSVDVGMMKRYYLDSREDVENMVWDTVSDLADDVDDVKIERNKFGTSIEPEVIQNV